MKKKIKDLTLEECQRICDTSNNCRTCPLKHFSPDDETIKDCPVSYEDYYMLREVETDESDNEIN